MDELLSHFIWIGSEFTAEHFQRLLLPNMLSQKYFFNEVYKLKFFLWVDREQKLATRLMLDEATVEVTDIQQLFPLLSDYDLKWVRDYDKPWRDVRYEPPDVVRRNLRKYVTAESGLTKPIYPSSSAQQTWPFMGSQTNGSDQQTWSVMGCQTKGTAIIKGDRLNLIPALGVDIIKMILGLKYPGLYVDMGLTSRSGTRPGEGMMTSRKWAELNQMKSRSRVLTAKGTFNPEIWFACSGEGKNYDLGIIYSTGTEECSELFRDILYRMGSRESAEDGILNGPRLGSFGYNKGLSWTFNIYIEKLKTYFTFPTIDINPNNAIKQINS